jgi:hypothetical protein
VQSVDPYLHFSATTSLVLAHLVPAAFVALFVVEIVAILRQARSERRLRRAAGPLALEPCDDAIVEGVIAEGCEAPVAVEITQHLRSDEGRPSDRGWFEVRRRYLCEPFYLELAAGRRIRIEPDDATRFAAPELETLAVDDRTRVRRACLAPGAHLRARGRLVAGHDPGGAFRGQQALVLRAAPGLTLAAGPLWPRGRRRTQAAALAVLCLLALPHYALWDYHHMLHRAVPIAVEITDLRTTTSQEEGRSRFVSVVVLPGQPHAGHRFEQEVWESDFVTLEPGRHLPARVVVGSPRSATLGASASLRVPLVVPPILSLVFAIVTVIAAARAARPWWEPPLNEDFDGAPGA